MAAEPDNVDTVAATSYTIDIDHCPGRVYAFRIEEKEVWIGEPYNVVVNYADGTELYHASGRKINVFHRDKPRSERNAQAIRFPKALADKYLQFLNLEKEIKQIVPDALTPPQKTVHKERREWDK